MKIVIYWAEPFFPDDSPKYSQKMIESFLAERKANLEFVARFYDFNNLSDMENLNLVFDNLKYLSNAFVDIGVFDEEGVNIAYQGLYKLTCKISIRMPNGLSR